MNGVLDGSWSLVEFDEPRVQQHESGFDEHVERSATSCDPARSNAAWKLFV